MKFVRFVVLFRGTTNHTNHTNIGELTTDHTDGTDGEKDWSQVDRLTVQRAIKLWFTCRLASFVLLC